MNVFELRVEDGMRNEDGGVNQVGGGKKDGKRGENHLSSARISLSPAFLPTTFDLQHLEPLDSSCWSRENLTSFCSYLPDLIEQFVIFSSW